MTNMKKTNRSLISVVLALILISALVSCTTEQPATGFWANATYTKDTTIGNGAKTIKLEVTAEEKTVTITVKTDKDTVGAALLEHGLIAGDESEYGLYVKTVNGMLADYDTDKTYWAFYINGEMAMTGVDGAEVTDGATYRLERAK